MIENGDDLFDQLVVAVGVNPEKRTTFSVAERMQMLRDSIGHLPHVRIESFENKFLVHYAMSVGARFILRGVRDGGDYEFERGMRHINHDLQPQVTTVFLMPPREIAEVSSSLVKGLIGPKGWESIVKQYVPDPVFKALVAKYAAH
jgi:pantetheine-phosphate adenylyltransferase